VLTVEIHYIASKVPEEVPMIEKAEKRGFAAMITIGIGERNRPGCISRDIMNDALKGLGKRNQKSVRRFRGKMDKINSIKFVGEGVIKSVKLAKTAILRNLRALLFGCEIIRLKMELGQLMLEKKESIIQI